MTSKYFFSFILLMSLNLYTHSQAINNAINFDGTDDYLSFDNLASPLSSSSNFTIEFWMKADLNENTLTPRVNLFTINPAAPGENKFALLMGNEGDSQSGHFSVVETDDSNHYLTSQTIIGDNECHHISYVREGNVGEAFLDGESIGTLQVAQDLLPSDRISLAQDWDNKTPTDFYNGSIDGFRIWNVARSQFELRRDMNKRLTGSEMACFVITILIKELVMETTTPWLQFKTLVQTKIMRH